MGIRENFQSTRSRMVEISRTSSNEVNSEAYLESLTLVDRKHLQRFLEESELMFRGLNNTGITVGIIGVGSTVRPVAERYYDPMDIDLRINTSMGLGDDKRAKSRRIQQTLSRYFTVSGTKVETSDKTRYAWAYKDRSGGIQIVESFDDDPSLLITFPDGGLPVHISVSGGDRGPILKQLESERSSGSWFTVLRVTP